MLKRLFLAVALVALLVQPAPAKVSVVLIDGRILEGVDVWREGDDYALETSPGEVIVIPSAFVSQVRLEEETVEEEEPEEDPDAWRTKSGFIRAEPVTLAGDDPVDGAASGLITDAKPETLAGDPIKPIPRTSEQLEVFGGKAEFQANVVENDWVPTTDWDMTNGVNDWAPSTWSKNVIDPSWSPTPAFTEESNQLKVYESEWSESIIDNSWQPTDAFAGSKKSAAK